MFPALEEFKKRLVERPIREAAYMVASYLLIDIPIRALEETVISWSREELSNYFGVTRPSFTTVIAFVWNWIVPAVGVFIVMLLYHRGNLQRQRQLTAAPSEVPAVVSGVPRSADRDGFLPFLAMLVAVAFFSFTAVHGFYNTPGPVGPPGVQGPPGPPGSPDIQFTESLGRVSNLEARMASIDSLIRAQTCLDDLNAQMPKDTVENSLSNARGFKRQFLSNRFAGMPYRGPDPLIEWSNLLSRIKTLYQKYYPDQAIDFNYNPSNEEVEKSVPQEPEITLDNISNLDLLHQYRRFYLQSEAAFEKIERLRTALQQRINSLKSEISQPAR